MDKPNHLKRLRPIHCKMIELYWNGFTREEIASAVGYTMQQVTNTLNSPEALKLLDQLQTNTLDSMGEVNARFQLAADAAAERLVSQLHSANEHIVHKAANAILDRAHGMPVRRVQVSNSTLVEQRYEGKSDDDIRASLAQELGIPFDGNGPDGRPLS